jgi:hypothetical protein
MQEDFFMDTGAKTSSGPLQQSTEQSTQTINTVPLKIFGVEIPLPHWAVSIIAVFAIVAVPAFLVLSLWHMRMDNKTTTELNTARSELNNKKSELAQANAVLEQTQEKQRQAADQYSEITLHGHEHADWSYADPQHKVIVTHYRSDGCVSVLRVGASEPVFNKDPLHAGQQTPAPGPVDGGVQGSLNTPAKPEANHGAGNEQKLRPGYTAVLRNVDLQMHSLLPPGESYEAASTGMFTGKCLNPHPGPYTTSTGRTQGCWRQMWRKWADGCTHYQWFNSCNSSWDADATGKPRVYWTACTH